MATLKSSVHVTDDNGTPHVFAAGDVPPEWAAKKIVNPKAWAEDSAPAERAPRDPSTVPPMSGSGSGMADWTAYAEAHNVDISEAKTRADVVALLDAAGVPTKP